jgi:ribosomal peptide maturation radical SAM protein 1
MKFRQKSPERVIRDLSVLLNAYPTRKVIMTDNIMPYTYFQTFLPRVAGAFPKAAIFYQQKANLSFRQVLALRRAVITSIQPGIESLSSRLLNLMNKGVLARQALMLLRHARAAGLNVGWGFLWGIPGDSVKAYEEILAILPLLHHLPPPCAMVHLSIERFSPYFSRPAEFGVRNIKPLAGYYGFLPNGADVERIAYHFTADYPCGAHDRMDVIYKLWKEIARWQAAWKGKGDVPNEDLRLFRKRRSYGLVDSRALWKKKRTYPLDENEAYTLLNSGPFAGSGLQKWALREKLAVIVDDWFVPLAVGDSKILLKLAEERSHGQSALSRKSGTEVD